MGFSLKRALAGAIEGGTRAAGEILDAQVKAKADDEARLQRIADAKELSTFQEGLADARMRSVNEYRGAVEKKSRAEMATLVKGITVKAREAKLDPGSAEGLTFIAEELANNGYMAEADKYNMRAESQRSHRANEDLRGDQIKYQRADLQIRAGQAATQRSALNLQRADAATAKEQQQAQALIDKAAARVQVHGRDGKNEVVESVSPAAQRVYNEVLSQGGSNRQALNAAYSFITSTSASVSGLPRGADANTEVNKKLNDFLYVVNTPAKQEAPPSSTGVIKPATTTSPAAPVAAPVDAPSKGFFEKIFDAAGEHQQGLSEARRKRQEKFNNPSR